MIEPKNWQINRTSPISVSVTARAKINLTLRVHGRLPTGFHRVSTIICPISLADTLVLTASDDDSSASSISITFSESLKSHLAAQYNIVPEDRVIAEKLALLTPSNLALRAIEAVCEFARKQGATVPTLHVSLHKSIPLAAGLGGGSADAAAAILATKELLGIGLRTEELIQIAAGVGSDVPAILAGKIILAEGRGESLSEIPISEEAGLLLSCLGVVLIRPGVDVSTADAFRILNRENEPAQTSVEEKLKNSPGPLQSPGSELLDFLTRDRRKGVNYGLTSDGPTGISLWPDFHVGAQEFLSLLGNDFQDPVISKWTNLSSVVQLLKVVGADKVLLAGSGSTVIGFFIEGHSAAAVAADRLAELVCGSDSRADFKAGDFEASGLSSLPIWISAVKIEP